MRTAIFLGLMAIAEAINKDWLTNEVAIFLAIVAVIMMVMDIAEFIKKMRNKTS